MSAEHFRQLLEQNMTDEERALFNQKIGEYMSTKQKAIEQRLKDAIEESADIASALIERIRSGSGIDKEALKKLSQLRAEIEAADSYASMLKEIAAKNPRAKASKCAPSEQERVCTSEGSQNAEKAH